MLESKKEIDTTYDKATITANMKTIIENVASFGDIKEGVIVEVKLRDIVSEPNAPIMGVASVVKVTSK